MEEDTTMKRTYLQYNMVNLTDTMLSKSQTQRNTLHVISFGIPKRQN